MSEGEQYLLWLRAMALAKENRLRTRQILARMWRSPVTRAVRRGRESKKPS
jgi:hypothetical protein